MAAPSLAPSRAQSVCLLEQLEEAGRRDIQGLTGDVDQLDLHAPVRTSIETQLLALRGKCLARPRGSGQLPLDLRRRCIGRTDDQP